MQAASPSSPPVVVPAIAMHGGRPMADSRDIASTFKKEHKRVLQTIRELHCSDSFRRHNFVPFKIKDLTGESTSHVLMSKSGFAFLVLGFTGAEPGRFKEAYIERFDAMEAEMARRAPVVPQSLPEALRLAADLAEANARQAAVIAIAAPKAAALDRIAETRGSLNLREAAKTLQVRPGDLNTYMLARGWLFRAPKSDRLVARQDRINAGLLEHKVVPLDEGRTVSQVFILPRGLTRLAQELHPDLFGNSQ